jgi:uncharacterized protein
MSGNILYSDEYLNIISLHDGIYMETFKKGCSLDHLNSILSSHPQISITNYNSVKSTMTTAPHSPEKIGILKERIEIEFASEALEAYIIFHLPKDELDIKNREKLIKETAVKLNQSGIIYGVDNEVFFRDIQSGKRYLIAKGTPPVNGKNSVINMYRLAESKPEINQDGTVDFYELKLINRVKVGDWLGERFDATNGIPGKSVKGEHIRALDGMTFPLNFDRNSVMEIYGNGKTTLYARIDGAVNYIEEKIIVSNHLEIDGDVDFKTGNLKFDGYITIKGTITDGFYVEATKDIEINGQLGIGNIKGIVSTGGSIFIKGGISSKGHVEIKAAKNVFTKFIDNVNISCGGTVHIGFYCINCTIKAKEVILDSLNGQIIGGVATAEMRISTPILGSEIEKKTVIEITGFNRAALVEEYENVIQEITAIKAEQQKLKQILSNFESVGQLNPFQRKEYNESLERILRTKELIKELEERKKDISGYLKTRGEGELNITKRSFPNCIINIRKTIVEINSATFPVTYYYQDGKLKSL